MSMFAYWATLAVALLHLGFAYFEMVKWEAWGPKLFKTFPPEYFATTRLMALNQGAYNGLLALGLIWAALCHGWPSARPVAICLLLIVVGAGLVGGRTASRTIYIVQAAPAVIALAAIFLT